MPAINLFPVANLGRLSTEDVNDARCASVISPLRASEAPVAVK